MDTQEKKTKNTDSTSQSNTSSSSNATNSTGINPSNVITPELRLIKENFSDAEDKKGKK
jgi:hypothetical protein